MRAARPEVDVTSGENALPTAPFDGVVNLDLASRIVACVAVSLKRYTDRSQLAIGFAGGPDSPLTSLLLDLDGDPSFADLVGQVEGALTAQSGNGDLNSDAQELDAAVSFGLQPPQNAAIPWLIVGEGAGAPELSLSATDSGSMAPPISELHEHVRTMLEATETDVDQPIGGLPILTERERRTLLLDWNQTVSPYPQRCLHDLIQDQVQRTPDAVAVECGDEGLTYRELDARANQLANHLRGSGRGTRRAGRDLRRALAEMLVGLLGI